MTYVPVPADEAMGHIGMGVHTGLRKAVESGTAPYEAIAAMPDDDWDAALRFCVEGLESMGYRLCKEEQP